MDVGGLWYREERRDSMTHRGRLTRNAEPAIHLDTILKWGNTGEHIMSWHETRHYMDMWFSLSVHTPHGCMKYTA